MSKPKYNKTDIEWTDYSWNPVTGCRHGCPYCYARELALRFPKAFPHGFEPTFIPERLAAPGNTKVPNSAHNKVFVCSMADLFGEWVPGDWIAEVLTACVDNPQWTYQFLTKNPLRLTDWLFPAGSWIGATVDTQDRLKVSTVALRDSDAHKKFISFEPLLEPIEGSLRGIDLVIIGAQTGRNKVQPKKEWVTNIIDMALRDGAEIFFKDNLFQGELEGMEDMLI